MNIVKVASGEVLGPGQPVTLKDGAVHAWKEGEPLAGRTITEDEARQFHLADPPAGFVHMAYYSWDEAVSATPRSGGGHAS